MRSSMHALDDAYDASMRNEKPPLAPYLRSDSQARVLAEILLRDGEVAMSEVVARSGVQQSTVSREVAQLARAGVVATRTIGRNRMLSANGDYPLIAPLTQIIAATYGPGALVEEAFAHLGGLRELAIFGSWAARIRGERGPMPGDVDVLLVGDVSTLAAYAAADALGERLGREVNVTVLSTDRWTRADDGFVRELRSRPLVQLEVAG